MAQTTAQKREAAKDLLADVFASMAGEDAGPAECQRVGLDLLAEALDIAKIDPERVEDLEAGDVQRDPMNHAMPGDFVALAPGFVLTFAGVDPRNEQVAVDILGPDTVGPWRVQVPRPAVCLRRELRTQEAPPAPKSEAVPDLPTAWDCLESLRKRVCDLERAAGFSPPGFDAEALSNVAKVDAPTGFEPVMSSVPTEALWNELDRRGLKLALNGEFQIVTPDETHPDGLRMVGATVLRPGEAWARPEALDRQTQEAPADGWLDHVRKAIDAGNITEAKRQVAIAVLDRHLTAERALSIINVLRQ